MKVYMYGENINFKAFGILKLTFQDNVYMKARGPITTNLSVIILIHFKKLF